MAWQYWSKKKGGNDFPIITDSSFDSFGSLRNYDITTNAIKILRSSDSTQQTFDWVNPTYDLSSIDTFLTATSGVVTELMPQKKTAAQITLSNTSGVAQPGYSRNGVSSGRGTILFNSQQRLLISGTLANDLSKNTAYFAVIILCKSTGSTQIADQYMFYISTAASTGRVRCVVGTKANATQGFVVAGRRATADSATTISDTTDTSTWNVVTAIFDYANQDLILRVNGTQTAINTSFGSGANSENTNSLRKAIGCSIDTSNNYYGDIAAITVWNSAPSSFSEIETIENRYKLWAGIP